MVSDAPSSSRMPVAPALFAEDLPPVVTRRDSDPLMAISPAQNSEWDYQQELRERERLSGLGQTAHGFDRWGGGQASGLPDTPSQMAEELRQQAEARAACGGLPDEPDDGGARGVTSKPYRF
jgi:hypothetical protein